MAEVDVKKLAQEQKELEKKEKKEKLCLCRKPSICMVGGQAIMEGIMMRGPHGTSRVVRQPNGYLNIEDKKEAMLSSKCKFFKLPLVRGVVTLVDSLKIGMTALYDSADIAISEEEKKEQEENRSKFDIWLEKKLGDHFMEYVMGLSLVLALLLSVGLFVFLPQFLSGLIKTGIYGVDANLTYGQSMLMGLFEGIIRMVIFFGYMVSVALMKDIKRVYMYHGAEHKTIWCYEKGLDLTVENARACSKHHPRCGTAFLFIVVFISILVTSIVPKFQPDLIDNTLLRFLANFGVRLVLLPFIAGISYEFNRLVSKHDNAFSRALRAPGLFMQRFTTKEPTDDMLELAIVALGHALKYEGIDVDVSKYEILEPEETFEETKDNEPKQEQ